VRFAIDSTPEGDGFELPVPGREPVKRGTGLKSRKRERICSGTEGSNPSPPSRESANPRSLLGVSTCPHQPAGGPRCSAGNPRFVSGPLPAPTETTARLFLSHPRHRNRLLRSSTFAAGLSRTLSAKPPAEPVERARRTGFTKITGLWRAISGAASSIPSKDRGSFPTSRA